MNRPRLGRPTAATTATATTGTTVHPETAIDPPAQTIVQATLTTQDMHDALTAGHAVHLSPLITDFIHHQKHWWIAYAGGWLRVDDAELIQLLTTQHQRFSAG
jgi:hypothetical protein